MASPNREHFGSRRAVIFAMAGSAIGLGNIWRFPYMVGEHGGATFVILYILATLLISLPVFISEVIIGRRSKRGAYSAMSTLVPGKRVWRFAGLLGVFIPVFIACYYSVIGGWSLDFLAKSLSDQFISGNPAEVKSLFPEFLESGWLPVAVHLVFMAICAYVVANGVKSGIERFSKITIPALFFIILLMTVYSVSLPGAMAGVRYLVRPDPGALTPRTFAFAMGQSFYSLSLGMGAIITYGSYVNKKENIMVSSAGTALFDLFFAILAGFAIMPAVFAAGMEPSSGPGLVFQGIPFIFSSLGKDLPLLSQAVSIIFFLAVVVAAMTSQISVLEVGVSYLVENHGINRKLASFLLFALCGGVGSICSLSMGPLKNFTLSGMTIFEFFDWFSSNIMLPSLAFLVVIFTGFALKKDDVRDEFTNGETLSFNAKVFQLVYFLIKWLAPVFLAAILVSNFIL